MSDALERLRYHHAWLVMADDGRRAHLAADLRLALDAIEAAQAYAASREYTSHDFEVDLETRREKLETLLTALAALTEAGDV